MADEQKWISKQKPARRLDVCEKTIDRLRASGELGSIRLGAGQTARVRIEVASLEAYEARQGAAGPKLERRDDGLAIPALDRIRAAKAARRASSSRASTKSAHDLVVSDGATLPERRSVSSVE
jgi:hypothetical protein